LPAALTRLGQKRAAKVKAYLVGGAVRDQLLGLPVVDRDYVVVGATPEQMVANGYLPVGKDFPVFIHPKTGCEYALARTERKVAAGYLGFVIHAAPDVSLEQDLQRRDLTINAIAMDQDGQLIDPVNGRRDLTARILRHIGPAFVEDPVRVLRLARFAARFHDFTVAPETIFLMQQMVNLGEVDALVPERIWQEISRGLMCEKPSRMFEVLRQCGALQRLVPELDRLWGVPQPVEHHPEIDAGVHVMMVIDQAAAMKAPLTVRYAALVHDLGKGLTEPADLPKHIGHEQISEQLAIALNQRWKVPTETAELGVLTAREHGNIHRILEAKPAAIVRLIERCDGFRRAARFAQLLQACEADARGRKGLDGRAYPQSKLLLAALSWANQIDAGQIAARVHSRADSLVNLEPVPEQIKQAIHEARVNAVKLGLATQA
jgi:tRNA nucleotidyltransferase (CCA-adding enzyme)